MYLESSWVIELIHIKFKWPKLEKIPHFLSCNILCDWWCWLHQHDQKNLILSSFHLVKFMPFVIIVKNSRMCSCALRFVNYIVVKLENDYTHHLIDLNVYQKFIKINHIFFYMIIKLVHNYILHIHNQYILQEITNTAYMCVWLIPWY